MCVSKLNRWGQIFILDSLAQYTPKDDREAQRYVILYMYVFYLYLLMCLTLFLSSFGAWGEGAVIPLIFSFLLKCNHLKSQYICQ